MATATSNAQTNQQQIQRFLSTVLSQEPGGGGGGGGDRTPSLTRGHQVADPPPPSLPPIGLPLPLAFRLLLHPQRWPIPSPPPRPRHHPHALPGTHLQPPPLYLAPRVLPPRHPPLVYLNPTSDMVIKRPHPHVTPSGLVSLPYLQNWVYPSSNLVDLARNLSSTFSLDPPLYSHRRPPSPPSPNPNPKPGPSPNLTKGSSTSGRSESFAYNGPRPAYPPYSHAGSSSSVGRATEDAGEVFKRKEVGKLVEAVHGDVAAMRKAREVEMEGLLGVQGVLKRREDEFGRWRTRRKGWSRFCRWF